MNISSHDGQTESAASASRGCVGTLPKPASGLLCATPGQLTDQPFSAFGSISQFKDAQRMAMLLAHSSIVPQNYRGDEHLGDCVIVLEIANRIGASVLAVMQNLQLVQGKPAWSSQFLISRLNATKRFSPLRYQMTGTRGKDNWGCIAWAADKSGQTLRSPEVTIKMAKEEGWYYRTGSKWVSMPELMLYYRSATLFTRLYAPEIAMGIQTSEEVADMGLGGNVHTTRPNFKTAASKTSHPGLRATIPNNGSSASNDEITNGETSRIVVLSSAPESAVNQNTDQYDYLKALNGLISLSKHTEAEVLTFLCSTQRCDPSAASLSEVAASQPSAIIWAHDNWKVLQRELSKLKKKRSV